VDSKCKERPKDTLIIGHKLSGLFLRTTSRSKDGEIKINLEQANLLIPPLSGRPSKAFNQVLASESTLKIATRLNIADGSGI
jgi:hypothetical protein